MEKEFLRYLRLKELQSGKKIIHHRGTIEKVRIADHNIEYDISFHNEEKSDELFAIIQPKKRSFKIRTGLIYINTVTHN